MDTVNVGTIYRHFKGNYYYIKDIAICSESREEYVVYKALYGDNKTYIRPLKMFIEKIDVSRPDNKLGHTYRFEPAQDISKDYTKI